MDWQAAAVVACISGVFSFGAALLVFRVQSRRTNAQNANDNAEAAESSANAVKTYSDMVVKLQKTNDDLKWEIAQKVGLLETLVANLQTEVAELSDHVDRLCHQIKSMGAEPVKRRQIRKQVASANGVDNA